MHPQVVLAEQIPGVGFSAGQIEDDISENTLDNVAASYTAKPVRI
jgi:hypothetical protein